MIQKAVTEDRPGSVTMDVLMRQNAQAGDLTQAELIITTTWYIWWQRRQCVKGEPIQPPERTATSIKLIATNFVRACTPNQPVRKKNHVWKMTATGVVKINVDASFYDDTLTGATGAIARDEHGEFIAASTWYLPHISDVDSAEIIAIRNGLLLAANVGCSRVFIESDISFAVEAVVQDEAYQGPELPIIMQCKHLASEFAKTFFGHCFIETNEVANSLAKNCSRTRSLGFWDSTVPDFISPILVNDLAII